MQIATWVLFFGTTLYEFVVGIIESHGISRRANPKRPDTCYYSLTVGRFWSTIVRAAPHIRGHTVVSGSNAMTAL